MKLNLLPLAVPLGTVNKPSDRSKLPDKVERRACDRRILCFSASLGSELPDRVSASLKIASANFRVSCGRLESLRSPEFNNPSTPLIDAWRLNRLPLARERKGQFHDELSCGQLHEPPLEITASWTVA